MKAAIAFVLGGGHARRAVGVRAGSEKMGKKQSGLSHKCYEAHEKLESPEQEKGEKHEGGEHK